jgi:hypothetical protein
MASYRHLDRWQGQIGKRIQLSCLLCQRASTYEDDTWGTKFRYQFEGEDGITRFVYTGVNIAVAENWYIDATATIKSIDKQFGYVRLARVKVLKRYREKAASLV